MVGLYVCWPVDWKYGWPMVGLGLPIGLFVICYVGQSAEPSGRFAIQPATDWPAADWPATWTSIYRPLTNQPKTLLLQTVSVWISFVGVQRIPLFPSGRLAAVGRRQTHAYKPLVMFEECFIQPLWGYIPPRLDGHYPNKLIWEHSLGVCDLVVMSFIRTYRPILMPYTAYIVP